MAWRAGFSALAILTATLLTTALTMAPTARAASVDCWLLDGDKLDQARDRGLCQDAFSRNSKAGSPPVITAKAAPIPTAKPTPPKRTASKAKSTRTAKAPPPRSNLSTASAPARPADVDFLTQFQRDWNSLMKALGAEAPRR
ncbi:hypothetical protein [Azospirillum soli]|uniref:hypothetical protein n=1 Tax=Azospirillum soli TaxID=1304799 RepID=UPI001AE5634D|nr:hypothetical protein [Azospirillum soli]MBP2313753.1 hypothetical protein [Azospirillum soli]